MDVFALRNRVVDDYKKYIESFVRIRDEKIEKFVREEFASGVLWPDPILQLNPAYQPGSTLDELARQWRSPSWNSQVLSQVRRRPSSPLSSSAASH